MYDKLVRLSIGKDFSNFYPYTLKFSQLPSLLCSPNIMYSPTQYNENKRKSANYKGFADFLVLDFDDGWTQEQEDLFNNFIGYKVPTKSHLKEKNGIVCERYRILLLLEKPVQLSYKEYKSMYRHIMRDLDLNSDKSCVDACRFYYSAQQDVNNCIKLKGVNYFPWEKYVYQDFKFAGLGSDTHVDINAYKDIDVSIFDTMHHSKRYPCPICQREGFDQKGHHLGFNKDEDYPTCFFDETHSKILRRLYHNYKYKTVEDKIKEIDEMVKERCTPDLIKVGKYDPKPTNYSDDLLKVYDKMLDIIESDNETELDIETFSEYYVAETLEEAEARLGSTHKYIKGAYNAKCAEYNGVALDTLKNKIRIITLGGGGAVCPFDMYYCTKEQEQRILNIIKNHFITGHNIKFDLKSIMASYGEEYCPTYGYDTMIGSRMIHMALDPEQAVLGHSLAAAAFRFLDYKMDKEVEHSWGNDNLTPRQLQYAGNDVQILRPLRKAQMAQIKQIYGPFDTVNYDIEKIKFLGPLLDIHPILALEMQTVLEMARVEHTGVKPNEEMMLKMIEDYTKYIEETDAKYGINCGSSKACVKLLQERISPNITSSSREVLWELFPKHPFVEDLIEAKAARTRRGLAESMTIKNLHPVDKRIHASFNQLLSTGRFACSNPNMQQIPKNIKNSVYQSKEDGIIFDTDYAAVELRLETVVADDPVMLDAYKQNKDLHYLTASKLFKKQIPTTHEEKEDAETNPNTKFITKKERGRAKKFNFGLIYGMGANTFMASCKGDWAELTQDEARAYIDDYFNTYTGVKKVIEGARSLFLNGRNLKIYRWIADKRGNWKKIIKPVPFFAQCKTLMGRVISVGTERQLMNAPVQGSGADAIKLAICKLGYDTRKIGSSYRTINLIHDDTVGECSIKDFDVSSNLFRNALEFAINYILRYKFYTPVNQDFCVLSMYGEEIFLEEAFTLKDCETKILELIKHDYDKLKEVDEKIKQAQDSDEYNSLMKKHTKYVSDLNKYNRILEKLRVDIEKYCKTDNPE